MQKISLFLVLFIFFFSCQNSEDTDIEDTSEIRENSELKRNNNKTSHFSDTIFVRQGDIFDFELLSESSDGYKWNLDKNFPDGIVSFKGKDYLEGGETTVSEGGVEYWVFSATKKGKCSLQFSLSREWDEIPTEIREFFIIIK